MNARLRMDPSRVWIWLVVGPVIGTSIAIMGGWLSTEMDSVQAAVVSERPNIVMIMTDDLDVGSLTMLLASHLMPSLQQHIIDQGTTFTESFVTVAQCCPSRATFLTGQYAHNHKVHNNTQIRAFNDRSTLGTWLQRVGYRTAYIGKYLNGYGYLVPDRYIPPGWDSWQALVDPSTYSVYDYTINDNGHLMTYGSDAKDYQTDVLAERGQAFIVESAHMGLEPFFLALMPLAPHVEKDYRNCQSVWGETIRPAPRHQGSLPESITLPQVPSFNESDVHDKPAWVQQLPQLLPEDIICLGKQYRDRLESLRAVDDMIGTVVKALMDTGILSRTIIIFTSDNGWFYGEHRLWGKRAPYEESIRVPLYIRVPGMLSPQRVTQIVLNNDLAPTIAGFARATPTTPMDGRSLVTLLRDPMPPEGRKRFLVANWAGYRLAPLVPSFFGLRTGPADLQTPNQLYVEYSSTRRTQRALTKDFYDLSEDPYQLQNLYPGGTRPKEIMVLRSWLDQLKRCAGSQCRALEDL